MVAQLFPQRATSKDLQKDLGRLPPGFHELAEPTKFSSSNPPRAIRKEVYISLRPVHPILNVCQNSRKAICGKYDLFYGFNTYVNTNHDFIFLDIGDYESTIKALISKLPPSFLGLALRDDNPGMLKSKDGPRMFDGYAPITLVHQIMWIPKRNCEDLVFIEYDRFWGDKFGLSSVSYPLIRQRVVAIHRDLVEPLGKYEAGSPVCDLLFKHWGQTKMMSLLERY